MRRISNRKDKVASLKYSEAAINRRYTIKVTGRNYVGPALNEYVGVKRLIELLGNHLAFKFINSAMVSKDETPTYRSRRGLKVTFHDVIR